MTEGGLFTEQPPEYTRCSQDRAPGAEHCDMTQDGWVQWADEMHHYGMLEKSYPSQLHWHLAELDRIARNRAGD